MAIKGLTAHQQDKIALISYATVSHMFALFNNPKMRGPNFTWDKFPEIAARHSADQVYLAHVVPETRKDIAKTQAEIVGKQIAKDLVKWMTED